MLKEISKEQEQHQNTCLPLRDFIFTEPYLMKNSYRFWFQDYKIFDCFKS